MKSKEQIKKWLLKNCVDGTGDMNLSGLDFSDFDGNIFINNMKVKHDLHQRSQQVGGNLYQQNQKVNKTLYQHGQEVDGNLLQSYQRVGNNLSQSYQSANGDLYQFYQIVKGGLYQDESVDDLTALCRKQEEYIKKLEEKLKTSSDTKSCETVKPDYNELLRKIDSLASELYALKDRIDGLKWADIRKNAWKSRFETFKYIEKYVKDYYKERERVEKLYEELYNDK